MLPKEHNASISHRSADSDEVTRKFCEEPMAHCNMLPVINYWLCTLLGCSSDYRFKPITFFKYYFIITKSIILNIHNSHVMYM